MALCVCVCVCVRACAHVSVCWCPCSCVLSVWVPDESECHSVMSDSSWPHGLYNSWNSSGQNAGVGRHALLQGIFPTQGWNPGLTHCRWLLSQLSPQGSPGRLMSWLKIKTFSFWSVIFSYFMQQNGQFLDQIVMCDEKCILSNDWQWPTQ